MKDQERRPYWQLTAAEERAIDQKDWIKQINALAAVWYRYTNDYLPSRERSERDRRVTDIGPGPDTFLEAFAARLAFGHCKVTLIEPDSQGVLMANAARSTIEDLPPHGRLQNLHFTVIPDNIFNQGVLPQDQDIIVMRNPYPRLVSYAGLQRCMDALQPGKLLVITTSDNDIPSISQEVQSMAEGGSCKVLVQEPIGEDLLRPIRELHLPDRHVLALQKI